MTESRTQELEIEGAEKPRSGLTGISYLALWYTFIVFMPAVTLFYLLTNSLLLIQGVQWAVLFLFVELSRLSGRRLSVQEATVIFLGAFLSNTWHPFLQGGETGMGWVYQLYFRHSPIAHMFELAEVVPEFYAPTSPVPWVERTFFHPSFIPAMVATVIYFVSGVAVSISLGLLMYQIFVRNEKLPFPTLQPIASGARTLTIREPESMDIMIVCTLFSMFYGLAGYVIPMVAGAVGYHVSILPLPWVDLNFYVHLVLPGASFGVATDLLTFASGLIIPFPITLSMFIGSFAIYFVGNSILKTTSMTHFAQIWARGMSIADSWNLSMLYVWACPLIGLAIAMGVVPLAKRPRLVIDAFRSLLARQEPGQMSLIPLLGLFLAGSLGLTVYNYMMLPSYPVWIYLIMNLGWPFLYALIATRAVGTATSLSLPYTKELTLTALGVTGPIWFMPMGAGLGASGWCANFKVCDLTGTTLRSYLKAILLTWPFSLLLGFLYTYLFWKISPMPSFVYPGINAFWPTSATMQALWISQPPGIFQPTWILGGAAVGVALYFAMSTLGLEVLTTGLTIGALTPIPGSLSIFLAGVVGKILESRFGKEWWRRQRSLVAAGIFLGQGIIIVFGACATLIIKSMWILPY